MLPFCEQDLSPKICGYRQGDNTQHALLKLVETCKKTLDKKGFVGAVLDPVYTGETGISKINILLPLYELEAILLSIFLQIWRYRRYFLCVANDISNTHVRSSLRTDLGSIPCRHILFWDRSRVNASEIYESIQFGIDPV